MKRNKYDAFAKVKRTIESCKTSNQLKVAKNMFLNYSKLYQDSYLDNILTEKLNIQKYQVKISIC